LHHPDRHHKQKNAAADPERGDAHPEEVQQGLSQERREEQHYGDGDARRPRDMPPLGLSHLPGEAGEDWNNPERVHDREERRKDLYVSGPFGHNMPPGLSVTVLQG
jgi:hypothetical protein